MTETFNAIVGEHIKIEGGLVDNPLDPGGLTKYGISQRFNPDIDVANLTVESAKQFYYDRYWKPMKLDLVTKPEVVRELFDQGAGPQGPTAAIKIVQGALNIFGVPTTIDGKMGPQTAGGINAYRYTSDLVKLMNCLQFAHFLLGSANIEDTIEMARHRLPQLREFMRGWLKRISL